MRDVARVAALVIALVVLGRNVVVAGGSGAAVAGAVVVGLFVLVGLTLWRDGLVTAGGVGLALHYVAALSFGDVTIDFTAPLIGALVLLYLDLGDLATSLPYDRRVDPAFLRSTLRHSGQVVLVGTLAGLATYALAAVPWPGGEWLRAAGALGVAAVVLVPLILLRRAQ